MSEDDKKEELFKRLKNIEDKNEEQLKLLRNTNKTSRKMKVIIIMTVILLFTSFTETFKALKIGHWSLKTMI